MANSEITKADLINLIDFEIAQIKSKKSENGWSPWVLFAALAALSWAIMGEVDSSHNWIPILVLAASATLLMQCLKGLNASMTEDGRSRKSEARFIRTNLALAKARPYLAFYAAKLICAGIILNAFAKPNDIGWVWHGWTCVFWAYVVVLFYFVIMAFIPFPISTRDTSSKILDFVAPLVLAGAIIVISIIAKPFAFSLNSSGIKAAALLFGISELITLILECRTASPASQSLHQIRRSLCLEEVSCTDAAERIKIILYGMSFDKILEPSIKSFFDAVTKADNLIVDFLATQEAVRQVSEEAASSAVTAKLMGLKLQLDNQRKELPRLVEQARDQISIFGLKAKMLTSADSSIKKEMPSLQEKLEEQINSLLRKQKDVLDKDIETQKSLTIGLPKF